MTVTVHPSAEVSPDAIVGEGTRVWQNCILMAGAIVGSNCKLAHNVFVENGARIGNGVTVKDNVVLYDGVEIADEVFVGPNAVFTNVKSPRAFISRKDLFLSTRIGRGASIGANATIVCGTQVGEFALIGAGSVVAKDVPDYALVVGNPAKQIGWVSRSGARLEKDLVCPETGECYMLEDDVLRPIPSDRAGS